MDDPELSPRARELLTDELRRAVGADHVEVPESVARASDGGRPHSVTAALLRSPLFLVTLAAALVVGAVLSLVVESWWLLGAAVGAHALLTLAIVAITLTLTNQAVRPDPSTVAELQNEGVIDPERELNDRLTDLVGDAQQSRYARTVEHGGDVDRPAIDDPAGTAAEQQVAVTPSARPTEEAPVPPSRHAALAVMAVVVVAAAVAGLAVHWGAGVTVLLLGVIVAMAVAFVVPTLRRRGLRGVVTTDPRPTVDSPGIEEQLSPHDLPPGDPARRALEERRDGR